MNQLAIDIKGLKKKYDHQSVLNVIDLEVTKGEIFALLGPNGAGKTTLINILTTLVRPDSGSAHIAGYDVMNEREEVKRSISLTGQFAAVDEMLTAGENLIMMGRLSGLTHRESRLRTIELLEEFDLIDVAHKKVKSFSGGMRRRLDLAVSLVVPRQIVFLDEPTTGLDTRSRRTLWDIILNLASEGVTVFLTTQYLDEADQLADTIAVISNGRIIASGTPEEMKSHVSGEVLELRNIKDEIIHEVPTNGTIHDIKHILEGLDNKVTEEARISIRRPSLDDVFLALTNSGKEKSL